MTLGLARGAVVVAPYSPSWADEFEAERGRLSAALRGLPATIEHIGSTAIPGLAAKPVLDIMVGRPGDSLLDPYVRAIAELGYEHRGEHGIPGRAYFVRGEPRTHHLHMVPLGGDLWMQHLAFRDHLRQSPEDAAEYAALKHALAERHAGDREAYLAGKSRFVAEVVRRALAARGTNETRAIAPRIRAKAVCVCRDGDRVLVGSAYDPTKRETFFGPPGGGVEFGERAEDAVRREMMEELGVELSQVALLGVLENIFSYDGQPGHEIVFVFTARLLDESMYARAEIEGNELGMPFIARWIPLGDFAGGGPPLYPDGLLALLRRSAAETRPTLVTGSP